MSTRTTLSRGRNVMLISNPSSQFFQYMPPVIVAKFSAILVKFVKNACENDFYFINSIFLVRFLQNLPISHFFMKCCHFFVFYRSESCKNQDDRELNKRKHGLSRKIYFIDFLVLF